VTVADLTERLVAIPSHDDETAAGDAIADWFETATVERDAHGNVFARQNPGGETQLAFVGHHDVVPPAPGQTTDDGGYAVERREGRLYGRGTADMVGSLAAAMRAVERVDSDLLRGADLELCFVSFVGEEDGGVGCRAAVDDGFAPDYAVVGEGSTGYSAPGVTDVAVAHKGRRGSTLTVAGEAAHASEPEAGVNAAYRAADAVSAVRELDAPTATVQGERLAGSLAVTGVESGSAWNVIPESATVTVDERTVPGERAALGEVAELPGVEWSVDQDLPPMACDDRAFADAVLDAARAVQADETGVGGTGDGTDVDETGVDEAGVDGTDDATPQRVVKPHATDAGWLARAGTTCVVCGASEPGEAHTDTESVSVAALGRLERIYTETVERVAVLDR
jgi:acetylornithine deacetylase